MINGNTTTPDTDNGTLDDPANLGDHASREDSNSIEVFTGMDTSPSTLADADSALRTGNPGSLEKMSFGGLDDGTPMMSYVDENGIRQGIRVTAGQWIGAMERRDGNRRELQYRIDAEELKDERHDQRAEGDDPTAIRSGCHRWRSEHGRQGRTSQHHQRTKI